MKWAALALFAGLACGSAPPADETSIPTDTVAFPMPGMEQPDPDPVPVPSASRGRMVIAFGDTAVGSFSWPARAFMCEDSYLEILGESGTDGLIAMIVPDTAGFAGAHEVRGIAEQGDSPPGTAVAFQEVSRTTGHSSRARSGAVHITNITGRRVSGWLEAVMEDVQTRELRAASAAFRAVPIEAVPADLCAPADTTG